MNKPEWKFWKRLDTRTRQAGIVLCNKPNIRIRLVCSKVGTTPTFVICASENMHITLVRRRAINAIIKISCVWKFCSLPRRKSAHYPWDTAPNSQIYCSHNWHILRYIVIFFALFFHPQLLITTSHPSPLKVFTPYDVQPVLCRSCLQDGRLHWLILHDELHRQSPPSHPYAIHC